MPTIERKRTENKAMDVFKFLASMIIAATHLPSVFRDPVVHAYYTEWFFRFCVPFYFLCSGYFFSKSRNRLRTIRRIGELLVLGMLLYLPRMLEGVGNLAEVISRLRWNLVFGYEHLWYLSAALEGLVAWYLLEKIPLFARWLPKLEIPAAVLLLWLGALLDEYYVLLENPAIQAAGNLLSNFGGPRNGLFMGLPLLLLGGAVARREEKLREIPTAALVLAWVLLRGGAWLECRFLFASRGYGVTNDLTFLGWIPAVVLLVLSFRLSMPVSDSLGKQLRKSSEYIYILHPLAAAWISRLLPLTPVPLLLATIGLCLAVYLLAEALIKRKT